MMRRWRLGFRASGGDPAWRLAGRGLRHRQQHRPAPRNRGPAARLHGHHRGARAARRRDHVCSGVGRPRPALPAAHARRSSSTVELEVSVLSPTQPVAGPEAIEVGRHGVVLAKSGRRAVFLPQVATEQGWTREQMLTSLRARPACRPTHGARAPPSRSSPPRSSRRAREPRAGPHPARPREARRGRPARRAAAWWLWVAERDRASSAPRSSRREGLDRAAALRAARAQPAARTRLSTVAVGGLAALFSPVRHGRHQAQLPRRPHGCRRGWSWSTPSSTCSPRPASRGRRILVFERSSRELERAGFAIRRSGGPYLCYGIDNDWDRRALDLRVDRLLLRAPGVRRPAPRWSRSAWSRTTTWPASRPG